MPRPSLPILKLRKVGLSRSGTFKFKAGSWRQNSQRRVCVCHRAVQACCNVQMRERVQWSIFAECRCDSLLDRTIACCSCIPGGMSQDAPAIASGPAGSQPAVASGNSNPEATAPANPASPKGGMPLELNFEDAEEELFMPAPRAPRWRR